MPFLKTYAFLGLLIPFSILAPAVAERSPLPDDARLSKPVTLQKRRIHLGELLETVAGQTGVKLGVDKASGAASGAYLTVVLAGEPLRNVMQALTELFTHRFNSAEWISDRKAPGRYVLRLARTPSQAAAAARSAAVARVMQDARRLHQILQLPQEARPPEGGSNIALMPSGFANSGRGKIFKALTPQELEQLLQGKVVVVPARRLAESDRTAVALGYPDAPDRAYSQADFVTLYADWMSGAFMPWILIDNPYGVASNVVGGPLTERDWLGELADGWIFRGQPELVETVAPLLAGKQPHKSFDAHEKTRWAELWSEQFKRSLIAHWAGDRLSTRFGPGSARYTDDEKVSFRYMVWFNHLMGRELNKIALLRSMTVLTGADAGLVSWDVRKNLREAVSKNEEFADLDVLGVIADLSEPEQLDLESEFGGLGAPYPEEWIPIHRFRSRLLPQWQKRLSSKAGLPLRDAGANARLMLLTGEEKHGVRNLSLLATAANRLIAKLRIEPAPPQQNGKPRRRVVWELYDGANSGTRLHRAEAFIYPRRDFEREMDRKTQPELRRERLPANPPQM